MQPWHSPFPIWNQSVVPCPVLTVASWPAYRFLRGQLRWSGILICLRIFQFVVIHTVKRFSVVNQAEVDVFLGFHFLWSNECWQINLHFPNPAVHLEVLSSRTVEGWLEGFWALPWSHVKWVLLCSSLNIPWHCPSLGLEWKLTFSSPVATAEFSKFAGIPREALSQHHLLGFKIAQLEFHHLH